jgi:carbamate kinase
MRVVVALGGNALLRRGEPMSAANQRVNVRRAAAAIGELVRAGHRIVVTHGNGPQVGLLALQAAAGPADGAYPLDVLGAESEGMIGYLIEQELANVLPAGNLFATLLTQTEVDPADPAFGAPTKPIGPVYDEATGRRLAAERGWRLAPDGDIWRRVVASPKPLAILESSVIGLLVERGVNVICAGGGGIPVVRQPDGALVGVEAVVDKDRASALLARQLAADMLIMLTDVDAIYLGFGKPGARAMARANPSQLQAEGFAAGSMGPKVEAAVDFALATGRPAAIGRLEDAAAILGGTRGTRIEAAASGIEFRA